MSSGRACWKPPIDFANFLKRTRGNSSSKRSRVARVFSALLRVKFTAEIADRAKKISRSRRGKPRLYEQAYNCCRMLSYEIFTLPPPPADVRIAYRGDPNRFGGLRLPTGQETLPFA